MNTTGNTTHAWGANPPHFIQLLATAALTADKASIAARVGISRTAVSLLLSNQYPSPSYHKVEVKVLAALDNVQCPLLGTLENSVCQINRELPFASTNPQRINLYRACQQCPNNPKSQEYRS